MIATDGLLTIASYAGPPNRLNAPFIMHCNSTECTGITINRLTTNTLTNGAFVSIANAGDGFPVMSFFGQLTDGRLLLTTHHCRNLNCTGPVDSAAHQGTGTFGLYSDLMVVPGRFATASYTNPDLFEAGLLYCRRDDCRDSSQVVFERASAENAPISLTDMDYQASLNRYVVLYQVGLCFVPLFVCIFCYFYFFFFFFLFVVARLNSFYLSLSLFFFLSFLLSPF